MATYVLGTHTSHNGSACLIKDGEIIVAIEKERITRKKNDGGNDDNAAVMYCLSAAGIGMQDIDLVVQNANFHDFSFRQIRGRLIERARRKITISHHLAHAYSALATSPFSDSNTLVVDGCGSPYSNCLDLKNSKIPQCPPQEFAHLYLEKDSFYHYDGAKLVPIYKDFSEWKNFGTPLIAPNTTRHSIGGAYFGISKYVFGNIEDPGKLMGLAPYGRPGRFNHELFKLDQDRVFVNYDWMQDFDRPAASLQEMNEDFQYYADIAYWAQREIERALLYVIDKRYEMHPSRYLNYAGGVALNAVANAQILKNSKYRDIYFHPSSGDNGIAIGCAYYGWHAILENPRKLYEGFPCFGNTYSEDDVNNALNSYSDQIRFSRQTDITEFTAKALGDGKIIGWFQGKSEFGPRALGHRSILALPHRAETRDFINCKIKFREDFRPFAPSVPEEDVARYFEQDYPSPFMILVSLVRNEWKNKIPAIVHVDGSARVQTVNSDHDPLYHKLHRHVEAITGCSVLLNTSFNRRGMPIVETPRHAVELFLETQLDILIIQDWVVEKRYNPFDA